MPTMSTKSPVFAVCGTRGHSLPTEPQRSFKTRRNASSDSLFSDLLPDDVVSASAIAEDYADVFGGPPKYASLSSQFSQLSLKRGLSRVSDASSVDSRSGTFSDYSSGRVSGNQNQSSPKTPDLRGYSEAHTRSGYAYTKLRSALEEEVENFRSYREARSSATSDATTKHLRRSLSKIKHEMNGYRHDQQWVHDSAPARMASSSRPHEEVTHKFVYSVPNMKVHKPKHSKRSGDVDDSWITVKDITFSTEPSSFPPPSRPPPGPSPGGTHSLSSTPPGMKGLDDWSSNFSASPLRDSISPREAYRFSSTQEHIRRDTMDMPVEKGWKVSRKEAVEVAEEKIRMAQVKRMVEKKLRETQRNQHQMDTSDTTSKIDIEHHRKTPRSRTRKERLRTQSLEDDAKSYDIRSRQEKTIRGRARKIQERSTDILQEREDLSNDIKTSASSAEGSIENASPKASPRSVMSASDKEETEITSRTGNDLFENVVSGIQRQFMKEATEEFVTDMKISTPKGHSQGSPSAPCLSNNNSSSKSEIITTTTDEGLALYNGDNHSITNFLDNDGDISERRKGRSNRDYRTSERVAKAVQELKQRDLQSQMEQAERHRVGELLDENLRHWACGKEGNLQALICSLQYVLWPECGWKPVSYSEMSNPVALKRAYRKATLCVHPDKVPRGASTAQKYTAEKVFHLLKEAYSRSMY